MSSRALDRVAAGKTYRWTAEGKTAAEIAGDIRHTQYRMDADVHAIKEKLSPRGIVRRTKRMIKWPAVAAALALVALLIRRKAKR